MDLFLLIIWFGVVIVYVKHFTILRKKTKEMYYIDYLKENKDSIPQEEIDNWVCFGRGREEDLRFFADRLNWNIVISQHQLSESFLREVKDYLDWDDVFYKQKNLSEDFAREMEYLL